MDAHHRGGDRMGWHRLSAPPRRLDVHRRRVLAVALPRGVGRHRLMTLVVITAATSPFPNVLARLLANRPLMKAGDLSYSLYLWHWPVIVYLAPAMQGAPELTRQVAAVVVTIAISTVSFTYVENPIHRHGLRGLSRLRPRLGPGLALAAGPMLLAGAVTLTMT